MIRTTVGCARRGLVNSARLGQGAAWAWPRCSSNWKHPQQERDSEDVGSGSIPSPNLLIQTYVNPNVYIPGPWILQKAAEYDLGFPPQFRLVKGQVPDAAIRVLVSPKHCIAFTHMKYFTQLRHPLTDKFFGLYKAIMDKPLWLQLKMVTDGNKSKSVVRSTSKRVVKKAFIQALKLHGYDSWGRARDKGAIKDLFGTVKLHISRPKEVTQTKFEDLVAFLSETIDRQIKSTLSRPPSPARHIKNDGPRDGGRAQPRAPDTRTGSKKDFSGRPQPARRRKAA
ncbi:hypothetical protein B0T19DRAFT_15282 [Cercophora scortea]|uniref:Uncharacterized protein n=1 Tax=Cercophora scortea TaxID=314031 RepID=A0AAE0J2D3_9PEZI|nr:hypothetical protein B0T19DRAFT_15282 [Cercophora scortea]